MSSECTCDVSTLILGKSTSPSPQQEARGNAALPPHPGLLRFCSFGSTGNLRCPLRVLFPLDPVSLRAV